MGFLTSEIHNILWLRLVMNCKFFKAVLNAPRFVYKVTQKKSMNLLKNIRHFATRVPTNLKGKKKSSQEWLTRQLADPYVERAKMMNYRCRSCFKLLEIDERHKFLRPGQVVVDVGCAPGSWSQICVKAVNSDGADKEKPTGIVIGIDKLQIYPIEGATFFGNTDFTSQQAQDKIKGLLKGRKVNCVLSDMAPNASGIRMLDQDAIMNLAFSVLKFALEVSAVDAVLLIKIWENGDRPKLEKAISQFYETCKLIKPLSSRSDSAENFIIAKGFRKSRDGNEL